MKFSVTVTLKKDVLDPQGKVVQNTLVNLGMNNLKNIKSYAKTKVDRISIGQLTHSIENVDFGLEI